MRLLIAGCIALFMTGIVSAQQKPASAANPVQGTQQGIAAQSNTIGDLKQRVDTLEQRIRILELKENERRALDGNKLLTPVLGQVKLELAAFDSGCESEQNRAVALALSDHRPTETYEGAAAMNCTERLKKIVDRFVEALEK